MLNIILLSRLYVIINDKMPFILVFILIVFLIVFVENDVILTDSGVIPWKEGDFAIIFYITLKNLGYRPATVMADMIKCCEHIDETDIDCNHLQLIGSNLDLAAQHSKNITLPYLNIYSYNRQGECEIRVNIISYNHEDVESTLIQKIYFDTSVTQGLHDNLKCEFPDEDHLDNCNLVNCHMKYSGYRGFFRTANHKCVQIPECLSKNNSNQLAYIWSNNQCVDLNHTITNKDIQEVLYRINNNKSDEQFQTFDEIHPHQKIRCHNGYLNNHTDFCECDLGWENENSVNWDDFIPSTIPLQMCSVREQISRNHMQSLIHTAIPENCTFVELIISLFISCVIIMNIMLLL